MKIAMLSSIAWRTPPRKYGPWEQVTAILTEGLLRKGIDVTLFATGDSISKGKVESVCAGGYAENGDMDAKVWECLHIGNLMERAGEFDLVHNQFDFLPLTYSRLIKTPILTTIHGFSSPKILPVYQKYNGYTAYISISDADRHPGLDYLSTIYHGMDPKKFTFRESKDSYLLYFGRIHPDKGTHAAIKIAQLSGQHLVMAGLVQDEYYYNTQVKPYIDGEMIRYIGNVGPERRDELLGGAKALLHPIYFEEPFGLSVAEAMMCGTPVIAFDRGSMRELLLDGITGYLVDDINGAVKAVALLDKIDPNACRAHALKNFSVEKMVQEYMKAYETLLMH